MVSTTWSADLLLKSNPPHSKDGVFSRSGKDFPLLATRSGGYFRPKRPGDIVTNVVPNAQSGIGSSNDTQGRRREAGPTHSVSFAATRHSSLGSARGTSLVSNDQQSSGGFLLSSERADGDICHVITVGRQSETVRTASGNA